MRNKILRWTAVVTYRLTHDTTESEVHDLEELDDLSEIIEQGPSFEAIENIVITYNFDEGKTIAELEPDRKAPEAEPIEEEATIVH